MARQKRYGRKNKKCSETVVGSELFVCLSTGLCGLLKRYLRPASDAELFMRPNLIR